MKQRNGFIICTSNMFEKILIIFLFYMQISKNFINLCQESYKISKYKKELHNCNIQRLLNIYKDKKKSICYVLPFNKIEQYSLNGILPFYLNNNTQNLMYLQNKRPICMIKGTPTEYIHNKKIQRKLQTYANPEAYSLRFCCLKKIRQLASKEVYSHFTNFGAFYSRFAQEPLAVSCWKGARRRSKHRGGGKEANSVWGRVLIMRTSQQDKNSLQKLSNSFILSSSLKTSILHEIFGTEGSHRKKTFYYQYTLLRLRLKNTTDSSFIKDFVKSDSLISKENCNESVPNQNNYLTQVDDKPTNVRLKRGDTSNYLSLLGFQKKHAGKERSEEARGTKKETSIFYPPSIRHTSEDNVLNTKKIASLFIEEKTNLFPTRNEKQNFIPYKKTFLCFWLLPLVGFIHTYIHVLKTGVIPLNEIYYNSQQQIKQTPTVDALLKVSVQCEVSPYTGFISKTIESMSQKCNTTMSKGNIIDARLCSIKHPFTLKTDMDKPNLRVNANLINTKIILNIGSNFDSKYNLKNEKHREELVFPCPVLALPLLIDQDEEASTGESRKERAIVWFPDKEEASLDRFPEKPLYINKVSHLPCFLIHEKVENTLQKEQVLIRNTSRFAVKKQEHPINARTKCIKRVTKNVQNICYYYTQSLENYMYNFVHNSYIPRKEHPDFKFSGENKAQQVLCRPFSPILPNPFQSQVNGSSELQLPTFSPFPVLASHRKDATSSGGMDLKVLLDENSDTFFYSKQNQDKVNNFKLLKKPSSARPSRAKRGTSAREIIPSYMELKRNSNLFKWFWYKCSIFTISQGFTHYCWNDIRFESIFRGCVSPYKHSIESYSANQLIRKGSSIRYQESDNLALSSLRVPSLSGNQTKARSFLWTKQGRAGTKDYLPLFETPLPSIRMKHNNHNDGTQKHNFTIEMNNLNLKNPLKLELFSNFEKIKSIAFYPFASSLPLLVDEGVASSLSPALVPRSSRAREGKKRAPFLPVRSKEQGREARGFFFASSCPCFAQEGREAKQPERGQAFTFGEGREKIYNSTKKTKRYSQIYNYDIQNPFYSFKKACLVLDNYIKMLPYNYTRLYNFSSFSQHITKLLETRRNKKVFKIKPRSGRAHHKIMKPYNNNKNNYKISKFIEFNGLTWARRYYNSSILELPYFIINTQLSMQKQNRQSNKKKQELCVLNKLKKHDLYKLLFDKLKTSFNTHFNKKQNKNSTFPLGSELKAKGTKQSLEKIEGSDITKREVFGKTLLSMLFFQELVINLAIDKSIFFDLIKENVLECKHISIPDQQLKKVINYRIFRSSFKSKPNHKDILHPNYLLPLVPSSIGTKINHNSLWKLKRKASFSLSKKLDLYLMIRKNTTHFHSLFHHFPNKITKYIHPIFNSNENFSNSKNQEISYKKNYITNNNNNKASLFTKQQTIYSPSEEKATYQSLLAKPLEVFPPLLCTEKEAPPLSSSSLSTLACSPSFEQEKKQGVKKQGRPLLVAPQRGKDVASRHCFASFLVAFGEEARTGRSDAKGDKEEAITGNVHNNFYKIKENRSFYKKDIFDLVLDFYFSKSDSQQRLLLNLQKIKSYVEVFNTNISLQVCTAAPFDKGSFAAPKKSVFILKTTDSMDNNKKDHIWTYFSKQNKAIYKTTKILKKFFSIQNKNRDMIKNSSNTTDNAQLLKLNHKPYQCTYPYVNLKSSLKVKHVEPVALQFYYKSHIIKNLCSLYKTRASSFLLASLLERRALLPVLASSPKATRKEAEREGKGAFLPAFPYSCFAQQGESENGARTGRSEKETHRNMSNRLFLREKWNNPESKEKTTPYLEGQTFYKPSPRLLVKKTLVLVNIKDKNNQIKTNWSFLSLPCAKQEVELLSPEAKKQAHDSKFISFLRWNEGDFLTKRVASSSSLLPPLSFPSRSASFLVAFGEEARTGRSARLSSKDAKQGREAPARSEEGKNQPLLKYMLKTPINFPMKPCFYSPLPVQRKEREAREKIQALLDGQGSNFQPGVVPTVLKDGDKLDATFNNNYQKDSTSSIFEKQKIVKKKRRLKKIQRETGRRKKRKRFFPRPSWLRYRNYCGSNIKRRSNHYEKRFASLLERHALLPVLASSPKATRKEAEREGRSDAEGDKQDTGRVQNMSLFNGQYLEQKNLYMISRPVLGDLKRLLWKSYWLRSNLNPYLTKVKKELQKIQEKKTSNLFQCYKNSIYNKIKPYNSTMKTFTAKTNTVARPCARPERGEAFPIISTNYLYNEDYDNRFSKTMFSKWQTALYFSEYNRVAYEHLQAYIKQIRKNLTYKASNSHSNKQGPDYYNQSPYMLNNKAVPGDIATTPPLLYVDQTKGKFRSSLVPRFARAGKDIVQNVKNINTSIEYMRAHQLEHTGLQRLKRKRDADSQKKADFWEKISKKVTSFIEGNSEKSILLKNQTFLNNKQILFKPITCLLSTAESLSFGSISSDSFMNSFTEQLLTGERRPFFVGGGGFPTKQQEPQVLAPQLRTYWSLSKTNLVFFNQFNKKKQIWANVKKRDQTKNNKTKQMFAFLTNNSETFIKQVSMTSDSDREKSLNFLLTEGGFPSFPPASLSSEAKKPPIKPYASREATPFPLHTSFSPKASLLPTEAKQGVPSPALVPSEGEEEARGATRKQGSILSRGNELSSLSLLERYTERTGRNFPRFSLREKEGARSCWSYSPIYKKALFNKNLINKIKKKVSIMNTKIKYYGIRLPSSNHLYDLKSKPLFSLSNNLLFIKLGSKVEKRLTLPPTFLNLQSWSKSLTNKTAYWWDLQSILQPQFKNLIYIKNNVSVFKKKKAFNLKIFKNLESPSLLSLLERRALLPLARSSRARDERRGEGRSTKHLNQMAYHKKSDQVLFVCTFLFYFCTILTLVSISQIRSLLKIYQISLSKLHKIASSLMNYIYIKSYLNYVLNLRFNDPIVSIHNNVNTKIQRLPSKLREYFAAFQLYGNNMLNINSFLAKYSLNILRAVPGSSYIHSLPSTSMYVRPRSFFASRPCSLLRTGRKGAQERTNQALLLVRQEGTRSEDISTQKTKNRELDVTTDSNQKSVAQTKLSEGTILNNEGRSPFLLKHLYIATLKQLNKTNKKTSLKNKTVCQSKIQKNKQFEKTQHPKFLQYLRKQLVNRLQFFESPYKGIQKQESIPVFLTSPLLLSPSKIDSNFKSHSSFGKTSANKGTIKEAASLTTISNQEKTFITKPRVNKLHLVSKETLILNKNRSSALESLDLSKDIKQIPYYLKNHSKNNVAFVLSKQHKSILMHFLHLKHHFKVSKKSLYRTFENFGRFGPLNIKEFLTFFGKPGEQIIDWVAYTFLIELSSDITNTIPETFDMVLSSSVFKSLRIIHSFSLYRFYSSLNQVHTVLTSNDYTEGSNLGDFLERSFDLPLITSQGAALTKTSPFTPSNSTGNIIYMVPERSTSMYKIENQIHPIIIKELDLNKLSTVNSLSMFSTIPKNNLQNNLALKTNENSLLQDLKENNISILNLSSLFIQRQVFHLYEVLLLQFYQPDTDLIQRQKKGIIFWDIWGDFLVQTAEDSNINISELTSLKEEQINLLEKCESEAYKAGILSMTTVPKVKKENNNSPGYNSLNLAIKPLSGLPSLWPKKESTSFFLTKKQGKDGWSGVPSLPAKVLLASLLERRALLPTEAEREGKGVASRPSFSRPSCAPFLPVRLSSKDARRKEAKQGQEEPSTGGEEEKREINLPSLLRSSIEGKAAPTKYCFARRVGIHKQNRFSKKQLKTDYQFIQFSPQQFLSYQGKDTELFIDMHPPKSFTMLRLQNGSTAPQQPIGSIVCQIYAGLLSKQVSKNILVVGPLPVTHTGVILRGLSANLSRIPRFPLLRTGERNPTRAQQTIDYKGRGVQLPYDKLSSKNQNQVEHTNLVKSTINSPLIRVENRMFNFDYKDGLKGLWRENMITSNNLYTNWNTQATTLSKSLLVQSIAGETELKIITDNAYRYAMVSRGVAVGIKLLKDVFDSLSLHTPCLFLLEDIHAIGERRPLLINDDENTKGQGSESYVFGSQREEMHEKNQISYQSSKHQISHYRKPSDFSRGSSRFALPTHHFCFDLVRTGVYIQDHYDNQVVENNSSSYTNILRQRDKGKLLQQTGSLFYKGAASLNMPSENTEKMEMQETINHTKEETLFQKNASLLLGSPAPSAGIRLQERNNHTLFNNNIIKIKKTHKNIENSIVSQSIRVKVAKLADMAMSTFSIKLDMITDLLVIMDSVKGHRGFVVFATTHVPSILDPALRRPGRFDETINLGAIPTLFCRWEILRSTANLFNSFSITHNGFTLSGMWSKEREIKLRSLPLFRFASLLHTGKDDEVSSPKEGLNRRQIHSLETTSYQTSKHNKLFKTPWKRETIFNEQVGYPKGFTVDIFNNVFGRFELTSYGSEKNLNINHYHLMPLPVLASRPCSLLRTGRKGARFFLSEGRKRSEKERKQSKDAMLSTLTPNKSQFHSTKIKGLAPGSQLPISIDVPYVHCYAIKPHILITNNNILNIMENNEGKFISKTQSCLLNRDKRPFQVFSSIVSNTLSHKILSKMYFSSSLIVFKGYYGCYATRKIKNYKQKRFSQNLKERTLQFVISPSSISKLPCNNYALPASIKQPVHKRVFDGRFEESARAKRGTALLPVFYREAVSTEEKENKQHQQTGSDINAKNLRRNIEAYNPHTQILRNPAEFLISKQLIKNTINKTIIKPSFDTINTFNFDSQLWELPFNLLPTLSSNYLSLYATPLHLKYYMVLLISGKLGEMLFFSKKYLTFNQSKKSSKQMRSYMNFKATSQMDSILPVLGSSLLSFPVSGLKSKDAKQGREPTPKVTEDKTTSKDSTKSFVEHSSNQNLGIEVQSFHETMSNNKISMSVFPLAKGEEAETKVIRILNSNLKDTWQLLSNVVLSFIHKRFLFNQNLIISRSFEFSNNKPLFVTQQPPHLLTVARMKPSNKGGSENPTNNKKQFTKTSQITMNKSFNKKTTGTFTEGPSTNILLPARRYENYKQSFKIYLTNIENYTTKPSYSNWFIKNKIIKQHHTYLMNQWWTAQLPEQSTETTFLSDIDWRYTFIEPFGDLLVDFPDADSHYNPCNRRWFLTKGLHQTWFNMDQQIYSEIYSHYIFDTFIKTYYIYEANRELLDTYAFHSLVLGFSKFLSEFKHLKLSKQF